MNLGGFTLRQSCANDVMNCLSEMLLRGMSLTKSINCEHQRLTKSAGLACVKMMRSIKKADFDFAAYAKSNFSNFI